MFVGQALDKAQAERVEKLPENATWKEKLLVKHRRIVGIVVPAVFFHFCWWGIFIKHNLWHLFPEKYYMSITMIFGSMMAGKFCIEWILISNGPSLKFKF